MSYVTSATDRKTIDTQLQHQNNIYCAQNVNSPKYLIVATQIASRIEVPNKTNNSAIFDNRDVRKNFVDIDGIRYPRDGGIVVFATNDYFDPNRDLIKIYKGHAGEEQLNACIIY